VLQLKDLGKRGGRESKVEGLGKQRKTNLTRRRPDRVGVYAVHRDHAETGKRFGEDGIRDTRERVGCQYQVVKLIAAHSRNKGLNSQEGGLNGCGGRETSRK